MDIYTSDKDNLVCANHYQGSSFVKDSVNINNIRDTDSKARFDRMNQLMERNYPIDVQDVANILRDKKGLDDKFIGYGNARSLNQLIAHHAIIFKPTQHKFWISTQPYQLGRFICYDLSQVFADHGKFESLDSLSIASDPFLATEDYKKFEAFKMVKQRINKFIMIGIPYELSVNEERSFVANNPESYVTYLTLGDYYMKKKNNAKAAGYYRESLKHEVSSVNERKVIVEKIEACKKV